MTIFVVVHIEERLLALIFPNVNKKSCSQTMNQKCWDFHDISIIAIVYEKCYCGNLGAVVNNCHQIVHIFVEYEKLVEYSILDK